MNRIESKNAGANGHRILVVEDEEMLRSMIEMVLRAFGYDVLSAASVEEAVKSWREHRGEFDLLLTDMVLPDGGSGKQIAERLKAERADLKVVYASGFTSDTLDVEDEKLVEGVNFLQKPYTTQMLAETVRQCLAA